MRFATARRWLAIVSPFVLLALGYLCLIRSPWPAIWRLMWKGEHVTVAATWSTVGLPAMTMACVVAAVVVSLSVKRR